MLSRSLKPLGVGGFLALLTYGISLPLPRSFVLDLHACLLAAIAAIYVGFAIADGSTNLFVTESVGALFFVILAAAGLHYNLWILIGGWIAHAVWDLIHHNLTIPGNFAGWYIPLCLSFDVGVGVYLIGFV